MDVAILGASGDCGREIAGQLVASRLLAPTERLQLVGRSNGNSAKALYGLSADLMDAHAEYIPDVDVALRPEEVVADVWVVACGKTLATDTAEMDRSALGRYNAPLFWEYARALARHGQGTEVVVIVSNPVELGVAIFAEVLGRNRVIGIGAYQDSLRFRREIASDLGVRRQRVGGFMLGEHGSAQVPIWSSVTVYGMSPEDLRRALLPLRRATATVPFNAFCQTAQQELLRLINAGDIAEAYRRVNSLPPDVRVVMKPLVTHLSGAKTVNATANVTIDLLRTILGGHEAQIAAQVALRPGDFYELTGPLGAPLIVGPCGVHRVVEIPLTDHELRQMRQVSSEVVRRISYMMEA